MLECVCNPLGDGLRREEIDQQPVFPVAHHLLHRRRARADDQAAGGHRLQEGPGKYERVREIDVDRRAPQHGEIVGVRDTTQKLHAGKIDAAVELGQHALPVRLSRRQPR